MSNVLGCFQTLEQKSNFHREYCIPKQLAGCGLKCEFCGISASEYWSFEVKSQKEIAEIKRNEFQKAIDKEVEKARLNNQMREWMDKVNKPITAEPMKVTTSKKVGGYFCVLCGEQDKLDYLHSIGLGQYNAIAYAHKHCIYENNRKVIEHKRLKRAKRWARIFRFFKWLGSL